MQSSNGDPRSYVRQIPLPVYIPHGAKIQARSLKNFNPSVPSREDMRLANIRRRQSQMTSQGFRSVNFKPYHGIGDPFYLDQRSLILNALGQLEDTGDGLKKNVIDGDDGIDMEADHFTNSKSKSGSKFILRRGRKGLSTLNTEVVQGRTLVRNVKLGHGLFDLIKQQRHTKRAQLEAERRRKEEAARTDWQPPKSDSSDEDSELSDDELGQDISLNSFMTEIDRGETDDEGFDQSMPPDSFTPDGKGRVTFSGMGNHAVSSHGDHLTVSSRVMSSRGASSRKKKVPDYRPYTPQHNSLLESEELETCSKDALFRQLCALFWLLECMNMDQPSLLGPVSQSWNLRNIGGSKTHPRRLHEKKVAETEWQNFVSRDYVPKGSKRTSARGNRLTPRRMTINPRHSILSIGSMSSVASPNSPHNTTLQEGSPANSSQEAPSVPPAVPDDDPAYNKSIFKFLDEYYASFDRDLAQTDDLDQGEGQTVGFREPTPVNGTDRQNRLDQHSGSPRKSFSVMAFDSGRRSEMGDLMTDRHTQSSMDGHTFRPKSSPALLEFQASLPSSKFEGLPQDLKDKFAEIKEDKASELNDTLEQIERNRLKTCQNKFVAMSVLASRGRSFHRAIEGMRTPTNGHSRRTLAQQHLRKKSSIHCTWFTDLLDTLPEHMKKEWHFAKILHKLTKYGLTEGSGKQSVYKFLNVLKGLRNWEICNPDVCAAIEYCRRNIVEMTVTEFEEWFLQTFPSIDRPQTAPPTLKTGRKGGKSASTISKG